MKTEIQSLIEFSVRARGRRASVMCAELFFAGQRFYAEMVLWSGQSAPERAVDLIFQTSHCLEQMLVIGLHAWLEVEMERRSIRARETGDEQTL